MNLLRCVTAQSGNRNPASLIVACSLLLAGCAGEYQAPMDDRSIALERTPPLIVTNGQEVPATPRRRPEIVGSSSGSGNSGTTSTSAGNGSVGASTTVVRPVAVGGGIARTTISRNPLPADEAPASEQSAAAVSQQPSFSAPATTTSAPRAAGAGRTHTVARGDTLYSIAWAHNIDYRRLALVNNLSAPYTIYPGQQLSLIHI